MQTVAAIASGIAAACNISSSNLSFARGEPSEWRSAMCQGIVTAECRGDWFTKQLQRVQGLGRSRCTCSLAVDTELDDPSKSFKVQTDFFQSCRPADREEAELFLQSLVKVGQDRSVRGWCHPVIAGPNCTWAAETLQYRVEPVGFREVVLQTQAAPCGREVIEDQRWPSPTTMDNDGRQFKRRKQHQSACRRNRWEVIVSDGTNDLRYCIKSDLHIRFTGRCDASLWLPRDETGENTIECVVEFRKDAGCYEGLKHLLIQSATSLVLFSQLLKSCPLQEKQAASAAAKPTSIWLTNARAFASATPSRVIHATTVSAKRRLSWNMIAVAVVNASNSSSRSSSMTCAQLPQTAL